MKTASWNIGHLKWSQWSFSWVDYLLLAICYFSAVLDSLDELFFTLDVIKHLHTFLTVACCICTCIV